MFPLRSALFSFIRQTKCRASLKHPQIINNIPQSYHTLGQKGNECLYKVNTASNQLWRNYAKGKDKKKEKGKGKVVINENLLSEIVNVESIKNQMQNAVEQLKEDFIKHVSLRSTTGSIEMLTIEFEGKQHILQELAQVVRKNPKTIVINMSVFPQAIPAVLKAIEKSGMNLNPQQDGTTLYIPIPKVTKEHREMLAKSAKQHFVKCKDSIREVQMKYVKQIKKKDTISEDIARNVEAQLIAIGDGFLAQADKILESKQSELTGKEVM